MKKIISIILSVLLLIPMFVTVYADDAEPLYPDAPVLPEGVETTVEYDGTEASGVFRFTPEHDGTYEIRSFGSYDTYGTLRTESGANIASNDDGGGNNQFLMRATLEAGVTYLLYARRYSSSEAGTFTVIAEWVPAITGLELSLTDPDATLYVGVGGSRSSYYSDGTYVYYYDFSASTVFGILTIKATYENGTEKEIAYDNADIGFSYDCRTWTPHGEANTVTVTAGELTASVNVPVRSYGEYLGDIPDIALGEETTVEYDGTRQSGFFRFVPERDGKYVFTSSGDFDTYGEVFDSFGNRIASNDDGGGSGQFYIKYEFKAGEEYYLLGRRYSESSAGTFTVTLTRLPEIVALELTYGDPLVIGIGGSFTSYYDYDTSSYVPCYQFSNGTVLGGLTISAEFEDGTVETISYSYDDLTYSFDSRRWTAGGESNTITFTYRDTLTASVNVPVITFAEYLADVPALTDGEAHDTDYDGSVLSGAYSFTPEREGKYEIYSSGDYDTYAVLYDSEGRQLTYNDDGGENNNFRLKYALNTDETYYILTNRSYGYAGEYTVTARRIPDITGLSLSLVSDDAHLVMGRGGSVNDKYVSELSEYVSYFNFYEDTVFGIIEINAEFEDGTSGVIPRNYDELVRTYNCFDWSVGGENTVTVSWGDVTASVSVPVGYYAELFPDAPAMELDVPLPTEYVSGYNEYAVFTPEESGVYYFYSDGDADVYGSLFDGKSVGIASNDDAGASLNFCIAAALEAGVPYVLSTRTYSYNNAEYDVIVSRAAPEFADGYGALEGLDLSGKMINLVFAVDTTGSMGWIIENVRNTLRDFVNALAGTNATLRISLLDYKDIDADGVNSTVLHYTPGDAIWFENDDLDALLGEIAGLRADGGGDTPESVVDVLGNVVEPEIMTFNSDAAKFVFLITDANYWERNTHGIESMDELVALLADIGAATSVITTKGYYETYRKLIEGTGGVFINLNGNFSDGMGSFAAAVASGAADYNPDADIVPVSGITLGEDLAIPVGKIRSFTAVISPANATDSRVVWSVEDETIARVSELSTNRLLVLRGISTGSTRVIARSMDGGYVAYFDLTVSGIVEEENVIEACDMSAIIERVDDLKDRGLSADLIFYSEKGDDPVEDGHQAEVFDKISTTAFSVTFVYDDEFGEMMYTWKFAGDKIEKPDIAVEMEIRVEDPESPSRETVKETLPDRVYRTVDFKHEGELPGPAEIKVAVDLPDGEYDLYYFNPLTTELESAGKATVSGGVATFTIFHCSGYVIAGTSPLCADGHGELIDAQENDVPPTCTEPGSFDAVQYCSVCGSEVSRTKIKVPANGHDFGEDGKAATCVRCGAANPDVKPKPKFTDVPADAYYAAPVDWAVDNGITSGTTPTTFSPEEGCTRGQVVTFLWRAAGCPTPASSTNPFKDVKEADYFYSAVLWAVEKGITKGTDKTHFSPDDTCTRGQIVTFLWRSSGSPSAGSSTNPFKDVKDADYFRDAVLWAVAKGITLGTDKTHFSPDDTCTRAQVVTFLYRDRVS